MSNPGQFVMTSSGNEGRFALPQLVEPPMPDYIGRYRIERLLGRGGFGLVYLAHDETLARPVAIKVPYPEFLDQGKDLDNYLAEARAVARLVHPNIVPVHDVGGDDHFPLYVVSRYIKGRELSAKLKNHQIIPERDGVELIATLADALHYAHEQGLIHRDVKPGNVLIDEKGHPYLVDFGLAAQEQDVVASRKCVGTPAYMSPEQACGEGHRMDRRSDIFSLGVMFYQVLTGSLPFRGDSPMKVLRELVKCEPLAPRYYDSMIAKELERICLRALAKRIADRYGSAAEFAAELRQYLSDTDVGVDSGGLTHDSIEAVPIDPVDVQPDVTNATVSRGDPDKPGSFDLPSISVVPKGLRSFDAHDSDFFLSLLPGPRDRDGLPDSVRFWKQRIDETDGDNTFTVGVVYGPSGCGKSSFLRAGLLPRLRDHVHPVFVEATARDTEHRLLRKLKKHCPALADVETLPEALTALRRGCGPAAGEKILLVIDQFEQWLHAAGDDGSAELIRALRQCDGGRVQCVVLVRDDFWMGATRFMRALEIPIVEGQNSAAVDLFSIKHAQKVLAAFGTAFGDLPDGELTDAQRQFIKRGVTGLAEDGKVICVRLALLAEMMKGKPWCPETLEQMGGTSGVGVSFLEETFSPPAAPPRHRYHERSARSLLAALLPSASEPLKGHMRSHAELQSLTNCTAADFDDLIPLLDTELRLISPADDSNGDESSARSYQLTHDYLVPVLREWLSLKQRESRRGRAALRLSERTAAWLRHENRRELPSLNEWVTIRLLVPPKRWSPDDRRLMQAAGRVHGRRLSLVAAIVLLAMLGGWQTRRELVHRHQQQEAESLVTAISTAEPQQLPRLLTEMGRYEPFIEELVVERFETVTPGSPRHWRLAVARCRFDDLACVQLVNRMLVATPDEFVVMRDGLHRHAELVTPELWQVAETANELPERRFRAACALAWLAPGDDRWSGLYQFVAEQLVAAPPSELVAWRNAARPISDELIRPLAAIFRDVSQGERARTFATDLLSGFASTKPEVLYDLLADADDAQFNTLYPHCERYELQIAERATAELALTIDLPEANARRRTNAAIALYKLGDFSHVWSNLRRDANPTVRTRLIHALAHRRIDPQRLANQLDQEPDAVGVLLALGEFDPAWLEHTRLAEQVVQATQSSSDAAVHSATQWLLRRWAIEPSVDTVRSDGQVATKASQSRRNWFVTTEGHTMVALPSGDFSMGSPDAEQDRDADETLHRERVPRPFGIAAAEVTKDQFQRFALATGLTAVPNVDPWSATDDSPQVGITWYEAASYCNWLSKQEGLDPRQWCYEPNAEGRFAAGMRTKPDYLSLSGYRLPTEAEWEYACRAGTSASRHFGNDPRYVDRYAWYQSNAHGQSRPVARLKPNDVGLFDMYGNALEWCQNVSLSYRVTPDRANTQVGGGGVVSADIVRATRGGAFTDPAALLRSANRDRNLPGSRNANIGFRPARTMPPVAAELTSR